MEKLIDITSSLITPFLDILLQDKTTKKNIIWATDSYQEFGEGFGDTDQIKKIRLLQQRSIIKPRIQKSLEAQQSRTRKKAEVFTPAWLCNIMNNYCDEVWFGRKNVFNKENENHTWSVVEEPIEFPQQKHRKIPLWQRYIDSRRLEITCGEAPYLVSRYDVSTGEVIYPLKRRIGLLDRKLRIVNENTNSHDYETWIKWVLRAFRACYGYEYQGDNVLLARINLFLTFIEYYQEKWGHAPDKETLEAVINRIVWNIWQMDGLRNVVPQGKRCSEHESMDLFGNWKRFDEAAEKSISCRVYNWWQAHSVFFDALKRGSEIMDKKQEKEKRKREFKFDFIIGNPPYQKESSGSTSKTNGQKPMTNIFQYFQEAADEMTGDISILIYPGGRWIHQSGKGMQVFGKRQINDKRLSIVKFYPDASELFGNAASLSDGITIVVKDHHKNTDGFRYIYSTKGKMYCVQADNPREKLMPLNPHDVPIEKKINKGVKKFNIRFLHDTILPRSLFPIESNFVEKNPSKVRKYEGNDEKIDFKKYIKLFTNNKAGKAGRATWFVTNKNVITKNANYISEWQVVVSSANAGGQKRDNQLEIIDNHSAFGRSRLALKSFKIKEEAENFYRYVSSYFIRYTFLLTDEALTSLGKEVPDFIDYSTKNKVINFNKNIDLQLCRIFEITDEEFAYMKNRVRSLRGEK